MQDNKKKSKLSEDSKSSMKIVADDISKIGNTVFHQSEKYIKKNYKLRFNEIALEIESKKLPRGEWGECNDNSLWIEIQKEGIKIGHSALKALLKSEFVPSYNPLKEYFKNLPVWDGEIDYILKYANYIQLSPSENKTQFIIQFKKWCVRAVKCVLNDGYFNKQAFVLTDNGKGQNIGKSSWCRYLCPSELNRYIAEDLSNNDKDTRILICKNFLINMDELAALSKKEINQLKSLFSKDQINDRLPYDSKNTIIPRVASFIGSTNKSEFLFDETGSVRWLCFVVESIDWDYKGFFDVNLLWSQAYSLSKNKNFIAEMTKEDLIENERRNEKFQSLTQERELLNKYFDSSNKNEGTFMTTTDIVEAIKYKSPFSSLNPIQMGKALRAENFEKVKADGVYGCYVIEKYNN